MPHPVSVHELLDRLDSSATPVLLPSALAADRLRLRFEERRKAQGTAVWTPPSIFAWTQWTGSLWTQVVLAGHDDRLLLNAAQEDLLWRDIITASAGSALLPAASLATLARSGWNAAASFRAVDAFLDQASSADARTFAAWAETFDARCQQSRLLCAAELDLALAEHIHRGRLAAPPSLTLCAASALTPARRALLESLADAGTSIDLVQLAAPPAAQPVRSSTVLADEREEMRFALRFAGDFLRRQPGARAALVLPDAAAERPGLEPMLLELLAPELIPVDADLSSVPWQIVSAGPLASAPVMRSLLDLAHWMRAPLPLERLTALLTAPHLCPSEDRDSRARFAAGTLGRQLLLRPELDIRHALRLARSASDPVAIWLEPLAQLAAEVHNAPVRRPYADWTEFLRTLARAAGWPGTRLLTAAERAATDAFDAVLDLVATLDFLGNRVTFGEACEAVETHASQAKTPGVVRDAALTILSTAEASDLDFDLVILARATDANLPPARHPHPLLDRRLQRQLGMPGADPRVDADQARTECAALATAATNLLVTSAAHNADGALRPSALPLSLGLAATDPSSLLAADIAPEPLAFDLLADDAPLPPLPSAHVPGGARLLKLQAACGFLAFAELRLGGRELAAQEAGFDAIESGNVLHRALEAFWKGIGSQQTLRRMSDSDREHALRDAIDQAVSRRLRIDSPWDLAYVDVQKERMLRLLTRWVDFELERSPFTVLDSEHQETITAGPLLLSVRLDRIDQLAEGGHVLVDYKTGRGARPAAWEGDRPDEPQLPLYALLGEADELRGLAFARVRAGKDMAWDGLFADTTILPRKKQADIAARREEWRAVLDQLALDFFEGVTDVRPKSYAINCKRCAQRLLCRLDVAALLGSAESDDDEEADGLA